MGSEFSGQWCLINMSSFLLGYYAMLMAFFSPIATVKATNKYDVIWLISGQLLKSYLTTNTPTSLI